MSGTTMAVTECASEQAFYDLWQAHLSAETAATEIAVRGGRLADRAAWVFVAGYQGALRQCFPMLRECSGWASFLVSEARDESKLPTCTLDLSGDAPVLDGTKNWVAASAHLSWLVVNSSKDRATTANALVAVNTSGVSLIPKPSGRFLPELEVGRAEFAKVALAAQAVLADEDTHVDLFGLIEARCLLVAMAAHFSQQAPDASEPAQSLLLSSGLATAELGTRASLGVLLEAMDLLVEWFEGWVVSERATEQAPEQRIRQRWADDKRLLQMHRPQLEKRLGNYKT